jgi:hypothetical protein
MMDKKPWTEWRVCGIFAPERRALLQEAAAYLLTTVGLNNIVYLRSKRSKEPALWEPSFFLEEMSTNRSNKFLRAAAAVTPQTLLILDDVETIRNYPQSMTRNIINHIAPLTRYKIIAGNALVVSGLDDLYAPFAVLDKRVLHANHYWCFAEDHREVSVFDGHTVMRNKDVNYLAAKLRPLIYFDLEPETDVQAELYATLRSAPLVERVQDVSGLRL